MTRLLNAQFSLLGFVGNSVQFELPQPTQFRMTRLLNAQFSLLGFVGNSVQFELPQPNVIRHLRVAFCIGDLAL